ncbi:MAG TPA: HAD family hydrolase [Candidatus Merdibacter merdavium]|uniref:HAD family hydrolase n=1 Tax=Candidatus Merdibacter merdavium TaxID=2838692 RepID=A0A9D2NRC7_9FIRM|nr:HAD family hydrolase [Candidatus Merdibacter merdavium]
MEIRTKIKTLICDLDGTLMMPGGGIQVSDSIAGGLLRLQESGVMVILASARVFQGVIPVARQIGMDRFGGYVIAQNGTLAYDVKAQKTLFVHAISTEDSLRMWDECVKLKADFAIAQPGGMIASGFSEGFVLDHANCEVDYLLTYHPRRHLNEAVWKCSVSASSEHLDEIADVLSRRIKEIGAYQVIRSTDTVIDITPQGCSKDAAVEAVLRLCGRSYDSAAAIGDGGSDVQMIRRSALGVTLENGSAACRAAADHIVPGWEKEGSLELIEALTAHSGA